MPRELLYIINKLRSLCSGRGAADAFPEGDGLAGYFSLEGSEN